MDEYSRADGKVVHLGQEVEAPRCEVLLFEALAQKPGHHGTQLVRCPICRSIVEISDAGEHAAWHRKLEALEKRVSYFL